MKKIVTGAEQSKAAKAASTGGHQHRAINVARVIAAEQKRLVRKVIETLDREWTVAGEERSAKTLKHRAADCRCSEGAIRFVPAIHSVNFGKRRHQLTFIVATFKLRAAMRDCY